MDRKLTEIVHRLERIFPNTEIQCNGYETIPLTLDWYEVINILKQNGLEIKNIK